MLRTIVIIALWIFAMVVSYIFGGMNTLRLRGKIVIEDTNEPEYYGKVQILLDEDIEEIMKHRYVSLEIVNNMRKKYNHDSED